MSIAAQAIEVARNRWRRSGSGWKIALVVALVLGVAVGLFALVLWLLGRLVKSLTVGGFRNADLYLPRVGRRVRG